MREALSEGGKAFELMVELPTSRVNHTAASYPLFVNLNLNLNQVSCAGDQRDARQRRQVYEIF
jgi:hypothetical protein